MQHSIIIVVGYVVFYVGLLLALAGDVGMLVIARRHGPGTFWGCLFLPPVLLLFLLLNLRATWRPFVLSLVGLVVAGLGSQVAGIEFPDFGD